MRAVIFDLFCTLVPGGSDVDRHRASLRMGAELGVDPETFADLYFRHWPGRFRGEFGDLRATIRAIGAMASPEHAPTGEAVDRAALYRQSLLRTWLQPTPQAVATLETLRRDGWLLGLLSNCAKETEELWPETPLASGYFDAVGLSSALGVAKPQPEAYLKVAAMLGVDPEECFFVGDGASNELSGAAAVGMRPIMVTELQSEDDQVQQWDGERLASIADLLDIIEHHG
jgi:putative hydrolase of the HAD superfamily